MDEIRMTGRGSGKTTRAMLSAPKGSIFIWCNSHLDYPKELARKLHREDLIIVSPEQLHRLDMFRGWVFPAIVPDPDTFLSIEQLEAVYQLRAWIRT